MEEVLWILMDHSPSQYPAVPSIVVHHPHAFASFPQPQCPSCDLTSNLDFLKKPSATDS